MSDPETRHDVLPKPKEQQEPPGHAAEMSPKPDRGDESHKVTGALMPVTWQWPML